MSQLQISTQGSRKVILNANKNCVNTISGEELDTLITQTLDAIYENLAKHCGPAAQLTLQTSSEIDLMKISVPPLTHDGIGIVRNMEFLNPVQQKIAQIIAYVGERVDSRAKDGTTTSMMIATQFLKLIVSESISSRAFHGIDRKILISTIMKMVVENFKSSNFVMRGEDIPKRYKEWAPEGWTEADVYAYLAYTVSMVASKGDRELSEAIRELVKHRPIETLGESSYMVSKVETEKKFWAETFGDAEFAPLVALRSDATYLNSRLGTEYIGEDVDLIVCTDSLYQGCHYLEDVENFIFNPERTKDVVLLTLANCIDGMFMSKVDKYNSTHTTHCLVFASSAGVNIGRHTTLHLDIINVSGKVYGPAMAKRMGGKFYHETVSCHYHHGVLNLRNIYKTEVDSIYNPRKVLSDWPPYNLLLGELTRAISDEESRHEPNIELINFWKGVLTDALCKTSPPVLMIGGNSMTAKANIPVVQDVLGSVMATLKHGFVVDGLAVLNVSLVAAAEAFSASYRRAKSDVVRAPAKCAYEFACALANAIGQIDSVIYQSVSSCDPGFTNPKLSAKIFSRSVVREFDELGLAHYAVKGVNLGEEGVVIQPLSGYLELLERLCEIGLNFIGLCQIQMTGAVLIDEESDS